MNCFPAYAVIAFHQVPRCKMKASFTPKYNKFVLYEFRCFLTFCIDTPQKEGKKIKHILKMPCTLTFLVYKVGSLCLSHVTIY